MADVPEVEQFVEPEKIGRLFPIETVERRKKHFLEKIKVYNTIY